MSRSRSSSTSFFRSMLWPASWVGWTATWPSSLTEKYPWPQFLHAVERGRVLRPSRAAAAGARAVAARATAAVAVLRRRCRCSRPGGLPCDGPKQVRCHAPVCRGCCPMSVFPWVSRAVAGCSCSVLIRAIERRRRMFIAFRPKSKKPAAILTGRKRISHRRCRSCTCRARVDPTFRRAVIDSPGGVGTGQSCYAARCIRAHTLGCCWVRQWIAPRPQISSTQSIPMTLRSGQVLLEDRPAPAGRWPCAGRSARAGRRSRSKS